MRISDWSSDVCSSDLRQFAGLTLAEAHLSLQQDIDAGRAALDSASRQFVERGLALWSADSEHRPVLIVRGQANLIDESAAEHLDRVRHLLDALEDKAEIFRLLDNARRGSATTIFIGLENKLFSLLAQSVVSVPLAQMHT